MAIKNIFFDFDGVLAESVNIKTEAFRTMYLKYGDDFAQRVVDYHVDNGGISRFEKFKIWNGDWLGQEITDDKITELASEFSDLVMKGVINADEVAGAGNFLENGTHYKKYIITGTPTTEIRPILEGRRMSHYFEGAYGSPEKKSYWVEKILKENNLNPDESVFIGDALADYKAAIDNKLTFILRETEDGIPLFKDFKGIRIKDLTELDSVLKSIN